MKNLRAFSLVVILAVAFSCCLVFAPCAFADEDTANADGTSEQIQAGATTPDNNAGVTEGSVADATPVGQNQTDASIASGESTHEERVTPSGETSLASDTPAGSSDTHGEPAVLDEGTGLVDNADLSEPADDTASERPAGVAVASDEACIQPGAAGNCGQQASNKRNTPARHSSASKDAQSELNAASAKPDSAEPRNYAAGSGDTHGRNMGVLEASTSAGNQPDPEFDALLGARAGKSEHATTAYAIFDASSGMLIFGRAVSQFAPLANGERLWYTGFETASYDIDEIPWASIRSLVRGVAFVDWVSPISTANWFAYFGNLLVFDAGGFLDFSKVQSIGGMFRNCTSLTKVSMKGWNVSGVRDVEGLFDGCSALEQVEGLDEALRSMHVNASSVSGLADLEELGKARFGIQLLFGDSGQVPEKPGYNLNTPSESDGLAAHEGDANTEESILSGSSNTGGTPASAREDDAKAASAGGNAAASEDASASDEGSGFDVFGTMLSESVEAAADALAKSNSIVAGAVLGAASLVGAARSACAASLIDAVSFGELLATQGPPGSPYAPFVAAAGLIAAISAMLAFALKL